MDQRDFFLACRMQRASLARWLGRSWWHVGGMRRDSHASLFERAVEDSAQFAERKRSIHFLSIHEHGGRRLHPDGFAFFHRGLDRVLVLRLDAGLELRCIEVMLLSLLRGHPVQGCKLGVTTLF